MKLLTYEPLDESLIESEQDRRIRECFNEMDALMKSYRVKFLHGYKLGDNIRLSVTGNRQVVCIKNRVVKE